MATPLTPEPAPGSPRRGGGADASHVHHAQAPRARKQPRAAGAARFLNQPVVLAVLSGGSTVLSAHTVGNVLGTRLVAACDRPRGSSPGSSLGRSLGNRFVAGMIVGCGLIAAAILAAKK